MMATTTTPPTTCFFTPSSSSSSSSSLILQPRARITEPFVSLPCSIHFRCCPNPKPPISLSLSHSSQPFSTASSSSSSLLWPTTTTTKNYNSRNTIVFALVEEEPLAATLPPEEEEEDTNSEEEKEDNTIVEDGSASSKNLLTRPCELYVCNLPSSCGITELHDLFKPYGTVQSVEVSRNAETGVSKGCGYVTMNSMDEARSAIYALDGSDVGGREMRIRFSADMNTKRKNLDALNSAPKKSLIFESPYKVYVGNLAWSVNPEDLRNHFSQFGTVVSARVLHDRKAGKNRVYGFLSFSTADESKSALSLNGTDFCDRTLILREVSTKTEP